MPPSHVGQPTRSFRHLASVISRVGDDNRYGVFETTRLHRWSTRVAIVGDAAHAVVPGLGQGCGTALVNALSLAVSVHDVPDVGAAIASWQAARRPLTEHTQRWSAIWWPKSRWPIWGVRLFYGLPVWNRWMTVQRTKPALAIPHGTEAAAPWVPDGTEAMR